VNNTGIIRKVDELGRIVLPKELRKSLNINSGDDFQISINNNMIVLEKYCKLKTFENTIVNIINCFSFIQNIKVLFTIDDKIINYKNEKVTNIISNLIKTRKPYLIDKNDINILSDNLKLEGKLIILPIVIDSDLLGSLIIVGKDNIKILDNYIRVIYNMIITILKTS